MELRISKSEILRGLRLAQSIADRKDSLLANVLVRASGKSSLLIVATDLAVSLSAELKSKNRSDGGVAINAKAFHEIVAAMPGDDIEISREENSHLSIRSEHVRFRLVAMPDANFPRVPDHRELAFVDVEPSTLRGMLERTLASICSDESRFHLNGVYFESEGEIGRMVSTDGHRLTKVEIELPAIEGAERGVIIPRKGVNELQRALADSTECAVALKGPHLFVRCDDLLLAVKLIDATFPPYSKVIPKSCARSITVDRAALIAASKRAMLMNHELRGAKLQIIDRGVAIENTHPELGDMRELLDAEVSGTPVELTLNPRYMLDALSSITDDRVKIAAGAELDPVVFSGAESGEYLCVVMPRRS